MAYSMSNMPSISPVSDARRQALLLSDFTLHVSLPPSNSGPKPAITHLHFVHDSAETTNGVHSIVIVPTYNRAIVVESASKHLRGKNGHQISQKKFNLETVTEARVAVFKDKASTRDTKWHLFYGRDEDLNAVHEVLESFFRLHGTIPADDLLFSGTTVRIESGWLEKLKDPGQEIGFVEVREPGDCELCVPTRAYIGGGVPLQPIPDPFPVASVGSLWRKRTSCAADFRESVRKRRRIVGDSKRLVRQFLRARGVARAAFVHKWGYGGA